MDNHQIRQEKEETSPTAQKARRFKWTITDNLMLTSQVTKIKGEKKIPGVAQITKAESR